MPGLKGPARCEGGSKGSSRLSLPRGALAWEEEAFTVTPEQPRMWFSDEAVMDAKAQADGAGQRPRQRVLALPARPAPGCRV